MGADGRDGGFLVVGVVDTDVDEDIQGVLPVGAGSFRLVQCMVGVGGPVVGAGAVEGLVELGGERQGMIVVGEGGVGVAGGVVESAEALPRLIPVVAVARGEGELQRPLVVVSGLIVLALHSVRVAEPGQRGLLGVSVAGGAGEL
jgi:hypothetical protein